MESDVMDAEGSLHEKSRVSDVMDAEGSLHQKPCEVCITEDTESIDLRWFDNTKSNRVKHGTRCLLHVGVRDWEGFAKQWQMLKVPKLEEKTRRTLQQKNTSGGTSSYTRPS